MTEQVRRLRDALVALRERNAMLEKVISEITESNTPWTVRGLFFEKSRLVRVLSVQRVVDPWATGDKLFHLDRAASSTGGAVYWERGDDDAMHARH